MLSLELLMALLLTFVGGFLELYSLKVHGVFAGMQTGNLITLFTDLIDGNVTQAFYRLYVLLSFLVGCFLAEGIRFLLRKRKLPIETIILLFELFFLLPLFFLPIGETTGDVDTLDIVPDIFLALFSSFQYTTFRKVNGESYATTMMTNLLSNIAKDAFILAHEKEGKAAIPLLEHFLVLLFFVFGVLTFYLFDVHFLQSDLSLRLVVLLPFFLLFLVLLLSILHFQREKKKEGN